MKSRALAALLPATALLLVARRSTAQDAAARPLSSSTYQAPNVPAQETARVLRHFVTAAGSIRVDAATGQLVVTEVEENLPRLTKIIRAIEGARPGDQLWLEPIRYASASDLAEKLTEIFDLGGQKPNKEITSFTGDDRTGLLVIVAKEPGYLRLLQLLRQAAGDAAPPPLPANTVMLEVAAIDTPAEAITGKGRDLRGFSIGGEQVTTMGLVPDEARRAVWTGDDPRVMTRSHAMTEGGKQIQIDIGRPLPRQEATRQREDDPQKLPRCQGSEGEKEERFWISITPRVNPQEEIRLEVAVRAGRDDGTAQGVTCVRRESRTTLIVHEGETIAIEGISHTRQVKIETATPVLGAIPLLGSAFRSSSMRPEKSELFLVVTPHLIRHQDDLSVILQRKLQEQQDHQDRLFLFGDASQREKASVLPRRSLLQEIRAAQQAARPEATKEGLKPPRVEPRR